MFEESKNKSSYLYVGYWCLQIVYFKQCASRMTCKLWGKHTKTSNVLYQRSKYASNRLLYPYMLKYRCLSNFYICWNSVFQITEVLFRSLLSSHWISYIPNSPNPPIYLLDCLTNVGDSAPNSPIYLLDCPTNVENCVLF